MLCINKYIRVENCILVIRCSPVIPLPYLQTVGAPLGPPEIVFSSSIHCGARLMQTGNETQGAVRTDWSITDSQANHDSREDIWVR